MELYLLCARESKQSDSLLYRGPDVHVENYVWDIVHFHGSTQSKVFFPDDPTQPPQFNGCLRHAETTRHTVHSVMKLAPRVQAFGMSRTDRCQFLFLLLVGAKLEVEGKEAE